MRANALRDVEVAFEKADIDGNGIIDYGEAKKLVSQSNSLKGVEDEELKIRVAVFF